MLTLIALASTGFAQETLDCAGLNATTCNMQNTMAQSINAMAGSSVIDESAGPRRLRPSDLYNKLDRVRAATEAAGCTIEGWTGGEYAVPAYTITWADMGMMAQGGAGAINPDRSTPGTYVEGVDNPAIGTMSKYNGNYRVFMSREDNGFAAGQFLRVAGASGVFATLHGTCPDGVQPAEVLNPWFGRNGLAEFIIEDPAGGDCGNPNGGLLVADNGVGDGGLYCYDVGDTIEQRAEKACESHFGEGNCCIITGGYNSQQYGECGQGGRQDTIHWHPDSHPQGHCPPYYVPGEVVAPGWCGEITGSFL